MFKSAIVVWCRFGIPMYIKHLEYTCAKQQLGLCRTHSNWNIHVHKAKHLEYTCPKQELGLCKTQSNLNICAHKAKQLGHTFTKQELGHLCPNQPLLCDVVLGYFFVVINTSWEQHTRELISTQKTSHKYNEDLSCLVLVWHLLSASLLPWRPELPCTCLTSFER